MSERWFSYSDVDGGALLGVVGQEQREAFAVFPVDKTGDYVRRADIAAAAPEMLQLLREVAIMADTHDGQRAEIEALLARIDGEAGEE